MQGMVLMFTVQVVVVYGQCVSCGSASVAIVFLMRGCFIDCICL